MRLPLSAQAGLAAALLGPMLACQEPPADGGLTPAEHAALSTLGPLGDPPPSPSNAWADDPTAAALGEAIFFDDAFSNPTGLACVDCHQEALGHSDDRPVSTNANGVETSRHSQTLTNVAYNRSYFWDGRSDSLWSQAYIAVRKVHLLSEDEDILDRVASADYYDDYEALFGPISDDATEVLVNCSKALEAYQRTFISRNSPLDRWLAGDETAVSEEQIRGAKLFVGKAGCIECHSGPNLTDGWFHNIGLALGIPDARHAAVGLGQLLTDDPGVLDDPFDLNSAGVWSDDPQWGAERLAEIAAEVEAAGAALEGAHKTPTLRDVTRRPLLGHNGNVDDLRSWIERYRDAAVDAEAIGELDPAYVPRDLSDAEITDLIAFLGALSGE